MSLCLYFVVRGVANVCWISARISQEWRITLSVATDLPTTLHYKLLAANFVQTLRFAILQVIQYDEVQDSKRSHYWKGFPV